VGLFCAMDFFEVEYGVRYGMGYGAKRRLIRRCGLFLALGMAAFLAASAARAAEQSPPAADNSAREVTDETGRRVALPREISRIVSLAPNVTETLFALGLGDRVVGDTNFCDYPPEAKNKPHVGGPIDPNIEKIASLHPDLVLATRAINRLPTVRSLEQVGIPVYATDPHSVEGMLASTEGLAHLLGADAAGQELVAGLRRRLEEIRGRVAGAEPKSVFFVVWDDPVITVGNHTFIADALGRAGARSIIDSSLDWPTVSLEEAVRQQPEYVIFFSDMPGEKQRDIAELRHRRGWSGLEALNRGRVIVLAEGIGRPAPSLVDAIEELARDIHPERFGATAPSGGRVR
jgi:iron complex transport system substrate-binding protein